MVLKVLTRTLWVTLAASILLALYVLRRPLCIDSTVVMKVDIIGLQGMDGVWSCARPRVVGGSAEVRGLTQELDRRLAPLEAALSLVDSSPAFLHLVIDERNPKAFDIQAGSVVIGGALLREQLHLEKGLVKAWILNLNPKLDPEGVGVEYLSELFLSMASYNRPAQLELDSLNEFGWPQAMKDVEGYCASEFKLAEHIEVCARGKKELHDKALQYSSYQFLFSSARKVWSALPLREKLKAVRGFSDLVSAIRPTPVASSTNRLHAAIETVSKFEAELWKASLMTRSFKDFSYRFIRHARAEGFKEDTQKIRLDVIVISDLPFEQGSPLIEQVSDLVRNQQRTKVAVKDPKQFLLMPSKLPLRIENMEDFVAERVAVLKCGRFDFNWIFQFETFTERLFVVDVCGKSKPDLRPWIRGGAEEFALANKEFRFVQFHIPSLLFKKNGFEGSKDVLSLLEKRDLNDRSFRALGWQSVEWSPSAEAYHPRGPIDAIDWFRLN